MFKTHTKIHRSSISVEKISSDSCYENHHGPNFPKPKNWNTMKTWGFCVVRKNKKVSKNYESGICPSFAKSKYISLMFWYKLLFRPMVVQETVEVP